MNGRTIARTAASVALIVLSTSSTASDCESQNGQANTTKTSSRGKSQVVIQADADACWKVTVDGRTHSGCGDATFYRHRSRGNAEVEKVKGKRDVEVTVMVDGKAVCTKRVQVKGQRVEVNVDQESSDNEKDSKNES